MHVIEPGVLVALAQHQCSSTVPTYWTVRSPWPVTGGCTEGSRTCMQLIRAVACTRTQLTVLHLGVRPPVSKPTVFCPPSGRHRCRAFLGTCLLDGRVWRCASIDRTPQIAAGMCSIARKSVRASVPGAERLAARGHAHEHVCERAVCPGN